MTGDLLWLIGERERLADRVLELEAPGECQSLHRLRAEVDRVEAERDEARAEIAVLREIRAEWRNEPIEGWRNCPRGSACYDRMLAPDRRLMTSGTLWQLFEGPEDEDGDGTEGLVCHGFSSERDTPTRGAMRAAEAAARSRGWT